MSLHVQIPRTTRGPYVIIATPGQTAFGFPVWLWDALDVEVRLRRVGEDYFGDPLVFGVDYTVSGLNQTGGATVTLSAGLNAGDRVKLLGKRLAERTTSVTANGQVRSGPLERELDLFTTVTQELRRDIGEFTDRFDTIDAKTQIALNAATAALNSAGDAAEQVVLAAEQVSLAADEVVLAREARDIAVAAAGAALVNINSRAVGVALTLPAVVGYVDTAGYGALGDGGRAFYRRAATEPSHAGKFRSLDRFLPNGATDAGNGGWWELFEQTVNPRMFGYAGAANERQVVRDMVDYPHARVVDGMGLQFTATADGTDMPGGYFAVAKLRSDTTYRNLKINFSASPAFSYAVHARGSEGTARTASSGIAKGARSITMNSVVGIVAGGYVRVATDELYGAEPSATEQRGEIKLVESVVGSTVTFTEGAYDTYASGNNLRLIPLTMLKNITLDKCEFVGGGDGGSEYCGWFEYVEGLRIIDCYTDNIGLWHWDLRGCINFFIDRCQMERSDSDQSLGLNYGIVLSQCCQKGAISDCHGRRFRHVWTGGGNLGVNRFITVKGGTAVECLDAGLDTHPGCEGWSISDLQISVRTGGPATRDGIMLEGANHRVSNCHVDGFTGAGIVVQTMAKAYHDTTSVVGCSATSNEVNVIGILVENYKTSGNCHGVTLQGNTVRLVGSGSNGIQVQSQVASGTLDRVTINGNIVNVTKNGIYAFDSAGSVHVVVINGNAVVTSDTTSFYGVRVDGVTRTTVFGNDIQGGWAGYRGSSTTSKGDNTNDNNFAGFGAGGAVGTP
jgi:hypothetical protein